MSSCVVKSCKNNTSKVGKESGITFHRFPKEISWKYSWIKIIRACRNEALWLPSKNSLICSVHFEKDNFYVIQGGARCHLTENAVPTLNLYDKIPITGPGDGGTDETITGNRLDPTGNKTENLTIKVEPTEIPEGTAEIETQTGPVHDDIVKVDPKKAPKQDDDIDLICLAAECCRYKKEIKRKNEQLKICRTKIKILNQKVLRYQKRNLKLKNVLKEIKSQKLIDKMVFRHLTAGLGKDDACDEEEASN